MAEAVLLTGATGFVGRAVLDALLRRGLAVHAVSRHWQPARAGVTWHQADLLQKADRARLTVFPARYLVHCAWEVEHGRFWQAPENTLWQAASVDLVQRFLEAGAQRVLIPGSCAEYDADASGPWNETRRIAPASLYGGAKATLHQQLTDLCEDRLIWARLFHLYGPGEDQRRLIPSLIRALRRGRPAEIRQAGAIRDYASTAHIAHCLAELLVSGQTGVFDIGSGATRSLGALGAILGDLAGRPGLLRLGDEAAHPAIMAPELTKLHAAIGPVIETPEEGLARLWSP